MASTGVFTTGGANPSTDGVTTGMFCSVFPDGSSVGVFVGRVTAVSSTTITVSLTAKSGTAPTDGTSNRTLKVGGAWKGPNAAEGFPFNFAATAMTNASGDIPRVNFKSGTNYAITAAMTHSLTGPVAFQGYTSSAGDGGRSVIDGGTSGTSYTILNLSGAANVLADLTFQNNGATGNGDGIVVTANRNQLSRVVVNSVRGRGYNIAAVAQFLECETYACNASNTANYGGFRSAVAASLFRRCVAHDNAGSNSMGFVFDTTLDCVVDGCVADTNGSHGFALTGGAAAATGSFQGCDAYNNGGSGISVSNSATTVLLVENCNFVKNGGYGVVGSGAGAKAGVLRNCGFGAGTQANTSGQTSGIGSLDVVGLITYASDVTPWVDPANGDFRVSLAAAKGAGRGAFTQTQASYTGTVGYPDVGGAQHIDSGGGGIGSLVGGGLIS